MNKTKNEPGNIIWFIIFGGIFCSALSVMANSLSLISFDYLAMIFISFCAIAVASLLFYNRKTMLITGGVLFAVIVWQLFLFFTARKSDLLFDLGYLQSLMFQITGYNDYKPEDSMALIILIVSFFALLTTLSIYKRIWFTPAAIAVLICYVLSLTSVQDMMVPAAIAGFVCLMILFLLKTYQNAAPRTKINFTKLRWIMTVCGTVIISVSLIAGAVLPNPNGTGFGATVVDISQYETPADFFDTILSNDSFAYRSGLSTGDTPLGGDLEMDDTHIMDVKADSKTYLTGVIYNEYTGIKWTSSFAEKTVCSPSNVGEFVEPLADETVFEQSEYSITPIVANDVLFYSGKLKSFSFSGDGILFTNRAGNYTLLPSVMPGATYKAAGQRFISLSDTLKSRYNENWRKNRYAEYDEKTREYIESIYNSYTNLPKRLPDKVYDLAEEITADITNDYDKAKAIEKYLCANFTYTLSPGAPPPGTDFTNYFLFDSKKGYCTSFASAMAVMSRCIGLPSRYVKGYVTPGTRGAGGIYHITNYTAHAWTEIYFDGIGWIPFEPTAVFNESYSDGAILDPDLPNAATWDYLREAGIDDGTSRNTSSRDSSPASLNSSRPSASSDISSNHASSAKDNEDKPAPDQGSPAVWGLVLFVIFALVVLGFAAFRIQKSVSRILRLQHSRDSDGVMLYFNEILMLSAYLGYPVMSGETAGAFAERIKDEPAFVTIDMLSAARLLEKAEYSGKSIIYEEYLEMQKKYLSLLKKVKSSMKLPKFLYLRFIKNII